MLKEGCWWWCLKSVAYHHLLGLDDSDDAVWFFLYKHLCLKYPENAFLYKFPLICQIDTTTGDFFDLHVLVGHKSFLYFNSAKLLWCLSCAYASLNNCIWPLLWSSLLLVLIFFCSPGAILQCRCFSVCFGPSNSPVTVAIIGPCSYW